MPLEQIKPAFSFYDSHIDASTSKQPNSDLSDHSNSSPSKAPTSLPYYYRSSLRSNKAGRRYSQSKGRGGYLRDDEDEEDSDQELEVEQRYRGFQSSTTTAEEEDSAESSPPSPLSPPETNNLNHSGDQSYGIRSIGGGGNSLREDGRDHQSSRHHSSWSSTFQNTFSHEKESSNEDGNTTVHQDEEEGEDQDVFKDSRSRQSSHENSNRFSNSSSNSYNWYSTSDSHSRERNESREDTSALTKLGGVGGVTRSGSWGKNDAKNLSSEGRRELQFQRKLLDQEEGSEKDEQSEDENRDSSRLRRRESTEGKSSNTGFGRGIKSIGKRRSIPTPSPPASPIDAEDPSASQLGYLSRSQTDIASSSSTPSDTTSKPHHQSEISNPQIPPYSRTSTTSTSSTRFSYTSTNSSYSDSSYSSYASSNPNAAPSALSLRSVSGSIKSNRDKERNRDSSSSLRSNRSAYSHKESPMEEQREDPDAEEKHEPQEKGSKEQKEDVEDRNPVQNTRRRSGSDETNGTEVGDKENSDEVVDSRKEENSNVNLSEKSPQVDPPTSLVSDSNSGFSTGGFRTLSRGSIPNVDPQEHTTENQKRVERREGSNSTLASESSPSSSNPETLASISSSPTPSAKRSIQSNRRAMAPLTLASLAVSTSSNSNNHPSVFSSSGSSTSNSQTVESPSASSSNSQFQFEPPVPRRHSGIYLARTRSALSSRHPTINSRFEHGHGGRAAARERAALENAKQEGIEQKARNLSNSSSLSGSGRSYAASQPASPLILSSSGSNFVSDWQGLTALSSINPALRSELDSQLRTPQASRAPLPSPLPAGLGSPSYFQSLSRRGSGSASSTPMPGNNHFSSQTPQAQALSPPLNSASLESLSSPISRSLGERKGLRALTVMTSPNPSGATTSGREGMCGLGLSPTSTPKGFLEGEGFDAASPGPSGSKSPFSRPKMQRASTTGHGMGLKLQGGVGQVLRTPTTEEWTRFLAERGGSAGMSGVDFRQLRLAAAYGNGATASGVSSTIDNLSETMSRSRSSSLLPSLASGAAAASTSSLPDPSIVDSEDLNETESQGSSSDSDPEENLQIAASMIASGNLVSNDPSRNDVGVLERLRRMSAGALSAVGGRPRRTATSSRASSSVRGSDLESLNEEDDEDGDEAVDSSSEGEADQDLEMEDLETDGNAFVGSHGRHGSSSSLERMNALYEAISRPQSRVTSPIMSPFNSPGRPSSPISSRISLDQDGLGSTSLMSLSSTNLSLENYARNASLGISPSSGSNLSLGSNSNPDLNKTSNLPSSPSRYQSPLLVNANTRRGSSHSQGSSPNPAGLSASSSFASNSSLTAAAAGASLLPPPNESLLTRESTLRPAPASASGPPSETGFKSSLASKREAANASAHAFGYPLPPTGTSRCINDFIVTADIGRGAYGLVKKVRIKGADGNPVGDQFIIKYIIKSRILADCWRRHRVLGPIPIEIHVMDQLRRLAYDAPPLPHPWSPEVLSSSSGTPTSSRPPSGSSTPSKQSQEEESLNSSIHSSASSTSPSHQLHPNICPMVDFFEDHEFYYLIMPVFGRGQDLFDYVESLPDGLSALQVRSIFGQVADALSFLHLNSIVHRDIKDENVILNFKAESEADISQAIPTAQLIDFGSATHIRPGRLFDTFSGTLDYAAAEILRGEKYGGREQDVWALGVVGYVLLCGECPFWNGEEAVLGLTPDSRAATSLQERCFPPRLPDEDPQDETSTLRLLADVEGQEDGGGRLCDAADLIARCLELDQEARPTAQQICSHKFLIGSKGWRGPRGWLGEEEQRIQSLGPVLLDGDNGELVHTST